MRFSGAFLLPLSLALLLAATGAQARPGGGPDPEVLGALARIDSLLAAGSWNGAVAEARALHDRHADDPYHGWQVETRMGVALLRAGDPASALPSLESAVRKAPNQPENHRNLATALVQLGRRGRALAEYAQAVEMDPRSFELRLEYGQLLLDFHDHQRARAHLLQARQLCGDCPAVQEPLARLFLARAEYEQAIPILEKLHRQRPAQGLRRSLIQALQGAGRDSVLLDFLSAGTTADLPADEAMLLVDLEGRLNRPLWSEKFALSVSDPEQEAALVPEPLRSEPVFWGRVSYNLLLAGRDRPALAAVGRAIMLDPDNAVFRNNRVVLLTRLGLHEEAAREWEKALALDPSLKEQNRP